jgi:Ca2+-binding EF-hand superfamily protein
MAVDLKSLPNLPGFSIAPHKERNHKPQTWGFVNGQRMEMQEGLSHDKPKFVQAPKPQDYWRHGSLPKSTTREVFQATQPKDYDTLPAWDALDRHVLRFYGFFKEAVVETNLENFRVRKCVIFYYLEDDTAQINEPRQDNSGLPHGSLIRRHRFPTAEGGYVRPEDLRIGSDLHVYGKAIRLTDCDGFTREYFASIGLDQPGAIETDEDPWHATRNDMKVKAAAQGRTYEKLYREVMLGGGHINENMQQFMENDRKVCRFFAVLDDMNTAQYERRPFNIMFFLADNTVEIREQYPLNCGRDNFPIFFRRGKLARGDVKARGPQDQLPKTGDLVGVQDLYVGAEVKLLQAKFFIYDADDFTRLYYKDVVGQPLEDKMDVRLPERAVPRPATPPYTGFGSWDDSMSSVLHLIPKVPKKDFHKLYNNDGKILRFTGRFVNPKAEDAERRFVFNFALFDDTLSIHEPPQRNLGIVTGKFLEKGVHLNQKTGCLFEPVDLIPGNIVKIFCHEFEMLDMDEYTRKFITQDGDGPRVDLQAVLEKLREGMRQQFPLVRDVFRRFDTDHNGVITLQEFRMALQKFGFMLSDEEVLILMRHFDKRQDGQVTYNEFCDALLDEDCTCEMMKVKPPIDASSDPSYNERAAQKAKERAETEKVRKAVRDIGDVFYKHVGMMQKIFKEFTHMTHHNFVTVEQVHAALLRIGFAFDGADVERCVLFVIPDADLDKIDYVHFCQSLVANFHDLCASR